MLQETFQYWAIESENMDDEPFCGRKRSAEGRDTMEDSDDSCSSNAQPAKRIHLVEQQLSSLALTRDELSPVEQQQLYQQVQQGMAYGVSAQHEYYQINKFLQLVHYESLQRRGHPVGLLPHAAPR